MKKPFWTDNDKILLISFYKIKTIAELAILLQRTESAVQSKIRTLRLASNTSRRLDLKGQRFNRLVVLERLESKNNNSYELRCECDCGKIKITTVNAIRSGQCGSCGCWQREQCGNKFRTHGKSQTREYKLLKDARKRSKEFKREFNLQLEDIIVPERCPILGIPLIWSIDSKPTNNSPSLDRVDSQKGYISGNVRVISMRANRLKQDSTVNELEKIVTYMKAHTQKND